MHSGLTLEGAVTCGGNIIIGLTEVAFTGADNGNRSIFGPMIRTSDIESVQV